MTAARIGSEINGATGREAGLVWQPQTGFRAADCGLRQAGWAPDKDRRLTARAEDSREGSLSRRQRPGRELQVSVKRCASWKVSTETGWGGGVWSVWLLCGRCGCCGCRLHERGRC